MIISDTQARKILNSLYHVAEKDVNDIIANAASALASRLELPKKSFELTALEVRIVSYALKTKPPVETIQSNRRKTYKRRVTLA